MADCVANDRHLDWSGRFNVRDLGGLPTVDGRRTRWGAVIRGDHPNRLSVAGWAALGAHGVHTIVDLRDAAERLPDAAPRPAHLTTIELPLEDLTDTAFWRQWRPVCCTPLYYRAFLKRSPGGVLIHCGRGRDRTGLVTLVLLALAGVSADGIAADHALSTDRLCPVFASIAVKDEDVGIQAQLASATTSASGAILAALAGLDAAAYLHAAGLQDVQVAAVRARLLDG